MGFEVHRLWMNNLQAEEVFEAKKVVVPAIFWHLSFWGSLMNIIYFIHVDRAPLIFANCFLPFVYARNLYMLYRHKPIVSPGDSDGG